MDENNPDENPNNKLVDMEPKSEITTDVDMPDFAINNTVNGDVKSIAEIEELETSTKNLCVEQEQFMKPKKHRRGKKKRQRSRSENESSFDSPCEQTDLEPEQYLINDPNKSEKEPSVEEPVSSRDSGSFVLIRPLNVPKAPMNSTQFIIDDHEDCGLYLSFEKPSTKNARHVEEIQHSPSHYKAAYEDIDYVYECDDWEDSSFCKNDFEDVYYKARFDVLIELGKDELIAMYRGLEAKSCKLQEELSHYDPAYMLNSLQQQLLKLQEENVALKRECRKLKHRVRTSSHSATSSLEDHRESTSSEEEAAQEEVASEFP